MGQAVSLSFRYTEAEYIAAVRQYFDPFRAKFLLGLGVAFVALGLFTGFVSSDYIMQWFLTITGLLALWLFYRNYYVAPRRWYKRSPVLREEYHLQYSDAGIVFRSKDINANYQWSLYQQVAENEQFYYLIYGGQSFSVIPKRAFTTDEQERAFRELLRAHIDPQFVVASPVNRPSVTEAEYAPKSLEPPDWRS
jgi:membrane associated rhomboid family serine protease